MPTAFAEMCRTKKRMTEFGRDEEADEFYKEATIWVDGLDRVQKLRGVKFLRGFVGYALLPRAGWTGCQRPFPWVVSDFGLIDAIESGLVKIPATRHS